jgi:hypothetical protein
MSFVIGRHTRGTDITCYQSSSLETRQRQWLVPAERLFIKLRPRPRLVCIGYSRCLPPKRCEISKWRKSPKASAKKAPGRDLRLLLLGRIGWFGPSDVRVGPAGKNGAKQSPGTRSGSVGLRGARVNVGGTVSPLVSDPVGVTQPACRIVELRTHLSRRRASALCGSCA